MPPRYQFTWVALAVGRPDLTPKALEFCQRERAPIIAGLAPRRLQGLFDRRPLSLKDPAQLEDFVHDDQ